MPGLSGAADEARDCLEDTLVTYIHTTKVGQRWIIFVCLFVSKEVFTRRSLASTAAPDRPGMGLPRHESLADPHGWFLIP